MSTVAAITEDVCEVTINNVWNDSVVNHFCKNEQAVEKRCSIWNRCGSSLAVGQRLTDVTSPSNVPQMVLSHLKSTTILKTFTQLC